MIDGYGTLVQDETATFALMMDAVSTSKMSVNFFETTRRNIP
jgi:hypothetical protein